MTFSFKRGRRGSFVRLPLTQNIRHALSRLSIMPKSRMLYSGLQLFYSYQSRHAKLLLLQDLYLKDYISGVEAFLSLFGALIHGKISVCFVKAYSIGIISLNFINFIYVLFAL